MHLRFISKILVLWLFACSGSSTESSSRSTRSQKGLSGVQFQPIETSDLHLTESEQRELLTLARNICDGVPTVAPSEGLSTLHRDIIPVLYSADGKRLTSERLDGEAPTLHRLKTHLPRLCEKATPDSRLHLLVVGYTARLPNWGIKGVFDQKVFEPMVTGLVYTYRGKRVDIDPLLQLEKNMGSKGIRYHIALSVGLDPAKAPSANELTVEIYRTLHIGETRTTGEYSRFFRGHQPLTADEVTHSLLDERLNLIGQWYRQNVINGEVTYEYSPSSGRYQNEARTMVRSTMSVWILNRLAETLNAEDLKALGNITIDHYLDAYFQMGSSKTMGSIQPNSVAIKSGDLVHNRWTSASFIAAAILERSDWKEREEEVDLLMRFAMSHKRDDNVLWTENGSSQFFMPGQLLLAVSYAYEKTKDERYKTFFDAVFDTYAPPLMQLMHLAPKNVAPYAPAWFTQPAARMFALTGDLKYRDLIYAINDRVVLNYERNKAYQVYEDYDGMLAPKVGSFGNNSITAAALESLVDAAITAQKEGDMERFTTYRTVVRHAVAFLLRLQFTPDNAYYMKHPDRVIGGFKKDMVSTLSWMDNVWHLTSAFMKIQETRLFEDKVHP